MFFFVFVDEFKIKLENYVFDLKVVRIIRFLKREGFIRVRFKGVFVAKGDVLIFLDAYCECLKGWLVLFFVKIVENCFNVVMFVIDEISD